MRVLVLLGREQDRDVDDRDDLVHVVEDRDGALEVGDDGTALLLGVPVL